MSLYTIFNNNTLPYSIRYATFPITKKYFSGFDYNSKTYLVYYNIKEGTISIDDNDGPKILIDHKLSNNCQKINMFTYSDGIIWIGFDDTPKLNSDCFLVNLKTCTYTYYKSCFETKSIKPIGQDYWSIEFPNKLCIYKWDDLLKLDETIVPFLTDKLGVQYSHLSSSSQDVMFVKVDDVK